MKDKFKKGVQAIGYAQDDTDAQPEADVHAPVEEGQKEQVKLFGAQEAKEPGWSLEPGGGGLEDSDEIDAPVKDRIHGDDQERIYAFPTTDLAYHLCVAPPCGARQGQQPLFLLSQ